MSKTIIIGDFSGIQNYLFDIRKNKSATKRLKGRSVFIETLLEKIKENLKQKLGSENFIDEKGNRGKDYLVSGGKFILICENFDENKFNEFKKDIEEKLFKQFYGELKIIFGISDLDGDFKTALNKAYEEVEKNKLRAFDSILQKNIGEGNGMSENKNKVWNEEMFVFEEKVVLNGKETTRGPQSVCKFSRDRLIDENMTKVINEKYLGKDKDKLKDFYGSDEETNWKISKEAGNDILITEWIRSGNNLGIDVLGNVGDIFLSKFKRDNIKKGLPFDENNKQIKTFEELAQGGNFNKLAVLKGDIDSLGEIFQFHLKEPYIENYKKSSIILDKFWKEELYKFIESNEKYKNKLYVVYAGGDDFVILGRWNLIIEFYKDLIEKFRNYLEKSGVDNILNGKTFLDIHFSGAIKLFSPHDTFFTIVKQAENLLEEAKNKDSKKNKVNIFGEVLENEDFVKIFEEAKQFYEKFVETDVVSRGTLRFLLDIAKKKILEENDGKDKDGKEKNFFEYGTWKAELFYHLARNYKTKKGNDKKDKFRRYIDGMLLKNEVKEFKSLSGKGDLLGNTVGSKLKVLISLVLYWGRD